MSESGEEDGMNDTPSKQGAYLCRCSTFNEEKQQVGLETAQDCFAIHADDGHEVELIRMDVLNRD